LIESILYEDEVASHFAILEINQIEYISGDYRPAVKTMTGAMAEHVWYRTLPTLRSNNLPGTVTETFQDHIRIS